MRVGISAILALPYITAMVILVACSERPLDRGEDISAVVIPVDDMAWSPLDTPLKQPDGKIALLKGSFKEPGPLVFLVSLPTNYKIPAHYHDTDEEIVVLAGSVYMGGGDGKPIGESNGIFYRKSDTHHLPAKTVHWLFTTDEPVIIRIGSEGPFATHWIEE
jgi:hypothetical protein